MSYRDTAKCRQHQPTAAIQRHAANHKFFSSFTAPTAAVLVASTTVAQPQQYVQAQVMPVQSAQPAQPGLQGGVGTAG